MARGLGRTRAHPAGACPPKREESSLTRGLKRTDMLAMDGLGRTASSSECDKYHGHMQHGNHGRTAKQQHQGTDIGETGDAWAGRGQRGHEETMAETTGDRFSLTVDV
eukprot:2010450-Lingulodinium_polyedra.AAC.1